MQTALVGVWGTCPISLLHDEGVTGRSIRVYVALSSFQGGAEKAWPSVRAIAHRAKMADRHVQEQLGWLARRGWVDIERRQNDTNLYRVRTDVTKVVTPAQNGQAPPDQSGHPSPAQNGHPEKNREKNTENNNGQGSAKKALEEKTITDVLKYLNTFSEVEYRVTTESHRRLVRARLHQGYSRQEILDVVWAKGNEWADNSNMRQYIAPPTLFGRKKFDTYIDQARARVGAQQEEESAAARSTETGRSTGDPGGIIGEVSEAAR